MKLHTLSTHKWFYPVIYVLLILIAMLPPMTQVPYDPRDTQDVIMNILMVSIIPYQAWGWVFHVATLLLLALIAWRPERAGRVVSTYIAVNYLVIAAVQTNAPTEKYGFALQTGAMVAEASLGLIWLWVAFRGELKASFRDVPAWRYLLLPLAVFVFWSPLRIEGTAVVPDFNPLLLLTSPDYGLTYCFVTPVFVFLLILFYPNVNDFAFRVTAFNGLIYGLLNLVHWFNPPLRWMGALHIPLVVIPLVALLMQRVRTRRMEGGRLPNGQITLP